MDQFAVLMLANEHVGARPPVPNRNHELSAVPERKNQLAPFTIQGVHMFSAAALEMEHPPEEANEHCPNRRKEPQFEPRSHIG